jgi:hypothetical protein
MRTLTFIKLFIVGVGVLFVFFSIMSLSTTAKLMSLLGYTLLSPTLFKGYLSLRGVRRGDLVLITMHREGPLGAYVQKLPGRALGAGRIGDAIEVEWGGKITVGEIKSYGGLFFPAEVNILYYGG